MILDRSKLKAFADDKFNVVLIVIPICENVVKMAESSPKRVENTVGKGETVRYEQFLLFSQCFQKTCLTVFSKDLSCRHVNTRACFGKG